MNDKHPVIYNKRQLSTKMKLRFNITKQNRENLMTQKTRFTAGKPPQPNFLQLDMQEDWKDAFTSSTPLH